jgi:hypothetical protein
MSPRYSVTITLTPLQAIDAEEALRRAAVGSENGRLYSAGNRIASGLFDAGWESVNAGSDDEPKWEWRFTGRAR